jgi:hypothetical protein
MQCSAVSVVVRSVNVKMPQHKSGGWTMRLPGLKYDDFNRAGACIMFDYVLLLVNYIVIVMAVKICTVTFIYSL